MTNNNSITSLDLSRDSSDDSAIKTSDFVLLDDILINSKLKASFSSDKYSGLQLFDFEFEELPKLVDPIFPKVGLASLVGSSDTGKSTLLRQLALSVAFGLDSFIGYKLNAETRNVIYVSTEDDPASTSVSLKRTARQLMADNNLDKSALGHLKFVFDADVSPESPNYIIKLLEMDLKKVKTDLIILDAFTDIFSGDINSSTKVREFLNLFSKIAKDNECLILFLHHTGKGKDKVSASKDNVLGSQAFEAKMRILVELRKFPHKENLRLLTITKGNYLSSVIKKKSKILNFNEETLLFQDLAQDLSTDMLQSIVKSHPQKDKIINFIKQMPENTSIRKIEAALREDGYNVGKSSVANYLQEIKNAKNTIL